MSEPAKKLPVLKLLLLGDSGVGKSSLMMRFADEKFVNNMISTAGVDFKNKKILIGTDEITLQIWDTAGQERFKTITQAYYRGAMGIVLVYDVTHKNSLQNVKYWMSNLAQHANQNVRKLIVGNKIDMTREVSTEEGKAMAEEFKIPYIEASAKTGGNVEDIFVSVAREILANWELFAPPRSTTGSTAGNSSSNISTRSLVDLQPTKKKNDVAHNSAHSTPLFNLFPLFLASRSSFTLVPVDHPLIPFLFPCFSCYLQLCSQSGLTGRTSAGASG